MSDLNSNVSPGRFSISENLYHYTTLDALLSILDTNCLWASDLESTNDPAELVHIRELGEQLCLGQTISQYSFGGEVLKVLDLPLQVPPELSEDIPTWVYQHFVSGIRQHFDRQGTRAWKSAVGRVFGMSFCLKGDLLSQWRGYALEGSGVSIGFDQKHLAAGFGPYCELAKVEYAPEIQISRIKSFIRRAFSNYCDAMNGVPIGFSIRGNEPDDIAIESGYKSLVADMAQIAHTFNRPGFSEEEEYRLIQTFPRESELLNEVRLRAKGSSLVPYVVLSSQSGKLPIREIIHGPAYESHNANYALVALLNRKGYPDVKITSSKYSLR